MTTGTYIQSKLNEYYSNSNSPLKELQNQSNAFVSKTLGNYSYPIGSDSQTTRSVKFLRPEGPESIQAQVLTVNGDLISTVSGDKISVAIQSASQKINECMLRRQTRDNLTSESNAQPLSTLSIVQQDEIINSLQPNGKRAIEMINDTSGSHGCESRKHLVIYDLS